MRNVVLAVALSLVVNAAYAQGPESLAKARAEFAEGLHQEESRDFAGAIERYKRVQAVRDTTPVRFRIATCLAASGQLLAARDAFEAVSAPGYVPSSEDTEVLKQSVVQRSELDARIPEVQLSPDDGKDATVRIDQKSEQSIQRPIRLDPGAHTLEVSRVGQPSKKLELKVEERARIRLSVGFAVEPKAQGATSTPGFGTASSSSGAGQDHTLAWVATVAGAAVMATGVLLLAIRESEISSIQETCRGGICPTSARTSLESQRSRALLFGPLGWIGVGLGGAGIGIGLYGLLAGTDSKVSLTYGGRF